MKTPLALSLLLAAALAQSAGAQAPAWPAITQQNRPWTRWWWEGSAVNPQDLTHLLTQYEQAGLGGVEITAIYGVKGAENQFIDFISPKWLDVLGHTLAEGKRLGLGVDMAQASGWPFGGPWVTPADACKYVAYQTYALKGGEQLTEKVIFTQKPIVTAIGHKVDIKQLKDPVATNPNLQALALEQVRFEKPLPLQALMAYPATGPAIDLTSKVDATGKLDWTAPAGSWTLYAIFQGWHGKQVERAGPGGEGDVIDHFSKTATEHYLQHFDQAFKGRDVKGIRAFFNDSYEVDDAQGEANWTPLMFSEFRQRRGYDLRQHLPALFAKAGADENQRVLTDYRETIAELLLENYTQTWASWAHGYGAKIRNQAHGSPANILDLYAATDIPETEGVNLTRIKFASSAAHVTGKPLTSAETATWENDHFLTKLSDVKKAVDRMLLGGVNHVFYHGTAYSPQAAAWPGWLFYAAVEFNPQNPFWQDFGQLNTYAARCQSFLQAGQPANDVLLYLPQYDAYQRPGNKALLQHFDGIEHGFKGLPVEATSELLLKQGFGYDFISDKQVQQIQAVGGRLRTSGGAQYQTILVPAAHTMPLATWQHLVALAQAGATVVVQGQLPTDVPGLGDLERRQAAFKKLTAQLQFKPVASGQRAQVGKGLLLVGAEIPQLLAQAGVQREILVDSGLQYERRRTASGYTYFLANGSTEPLSTWVPLATAAKSAALYDPLTGQLGMAALRQSAQGRPEVYVQLAPGSSCLLDTKAAAAAGGSRAYAYRHPAGAPLPVAGPWAVRFVSGGPTLPAPVQVAQLGSWTTLAGEAGQKFAGTATYTTTFARPAGNAAGYVLDLGRVGQSARVQLNGQELGTLIGPVYQAYIAASQLKASNELAISVSNGMANRIADMDRQHQEWKIFYNVNMAARLKENRGDDGLFTAAQWTPVASGLLGPVTLTPTTTDSSPR